MAPWDPRTFTIHAASNGDLEVDLIPFVLDVWMFQLLQLFLQSAVSLFLVCFFFFSVVFLCCRWFRFSYACCRVLGFIAENHCAGLATSGVNFTSVLIISFLQTCKWFQIWKSWEVCQKSPLAIPFIFTSLVLPGKTPSAAVCRLRKNGWNDVVLQAVASSHLLVIKQKGNRESTSRMLQVGEPSWPELVLFPFCFFEKYLLSRPHLFVLDERSCIILSPSDSSEIYRRSCRIAIK